MFILSLAILAAVYVRYSPNQNSIPESGDLALGERRDRQAGFVFSDLGCRYHIICTFKEQVK